MGQVRVVPAGEHDGLDGIERLRDLVHEGTAVVQYEDLPVPFVLDADACEHLLTSSTVAGAVAMPVLEHASGITDGPLHQLWSVLMFGKDGEEHDRLRRRVSAWFTPHAVERYRPVAQATADELCRWAGARMDAFDGFALPLTARVQAALLGIPDEDLEFVTPWALQLVLGFGVMTPEVAKPTEEAASCFREYLHELFERKRSDPADDVISDLARGEDDLTETEREGLAANLMFGGLDATAKAITTALWLLLSNPEQLDAARRAPDATVREALRVRPPATAVLRLALADVEVAGCPITAGTVLGASLAGPTSDPRRFPDPGRFDVSRPAGKQFAFGAGAHYCLGANLAKLTMGVAVETFLRCFPDATLADGPWEYDTSLFHGFTRLAITTGAA